MQSQTCRRIPYAIEPLLRTAASDMGSLREQGCRPATRSGDGSPEPPLFWAETGHLRLRRPSCFSRVAQMQFNRAQHAQVSDFHQLDIH